MGLVNAGKENHKRKGNESNVQDSFWIFFHCRVVCLKQKRAKLTDIFLRGLWLWIFNPNKRPDLVHVES